MKFKQVDKCGDLMSAVPYLSSCIFRFVDFTILFRHVIYSDLTYTHMSQAIIDVTFVIYFEVIPDPNFSFQINCRGQ